MADVDEGHDDEDGEGDGEEEEQHGGDHLGQRAHLLGGKGSKGNQSNLLKVNWVKRRGKVIRIQERSGGDRGIGHSSGWIAISTHQRLLAPTSRSWGSHQHPPLSGPTQFSDRPKILKEFYAGPLFPPFPLRCQTHCIWMKKRLPKRYQKSTFSKQKHLLSSCQTTVAQLSKQAHVVQGISIVVNSKLQWNSFRQRQRIVWRRGKIKEISAVPIPIES